MVRELIKSKRRSITGKTMKNVKKRGGERKKKEKRRKKEKMEERITCLSNLDICVLRCLLYPSLPIFFSSLFLASLHSLPL